MTFNDAKNYCETLEFENSHLVEIYNSTQQTFLKENLLQKNENLQLWIGLTDSEEEGVWKWASSGNIATYFSWGKGEPSNKGHNCVRLYYGEDYAWFDNTCNTHYGFICQFDF